jgi:hypothetical protein
MYLKKVRSKKTEGQQKFLVDTLKIAYENNRIRIRIRTKISWIRNTAKKEVE